MKKNMFPDKKSKGKYFLLSIVALVEILVLLAVSTYAWVETVSTIRIYTSDSAVAKVDANPTGQLLTHNFQKATFSSTAATPIDLSQMYHESGAFHLAPASSADGKTIFFPHYQPDGSVDDYRKADSSDNMVNYVSFSFRVAAAGYYVFDADPTISFGGTAVDPNSTLVRLSLQVEEGTPAIYSKDTSTTAVVNAIGGGTGATNVRAFSSYTGGNEKYALHTTSANQIVTVRLWIQDPTHASSTTYTGKQLSITNLKLVPAYKVTTYVTLNKTAATSSTHASAAAGTVKAGSATASWSSTAYVKHGSTVPLVATNADSTIYTWKGWYSEASQTNLKYSSASATSTAITSNTNLYACFTSKIAISATAVLGNGTAASSAGTVKVGSASAGSTSSYSYDYGSAVSLTASANSGYTFVGWYDGTGSGASRLSTSANYTPGTATVAKTYYARFMQNPTITAKAVLGTDTSASTTYGTVKVGSATAGATSSSTVAYDGSVTLTATPTANYAIIGWYKGTPSDSTFVSNSNGKTSITVNNVTANATYYCSFKQKATTTLYFTDRAYGDSNTYVYVWGKSTDQKYSDVWGTNGGTQMSFDKSIGLYKFTFTTGEDEDIGIIISKKGDNTLRSEYTAHIGETCLIKQSGSTIDRSFSLGSKRFFYCTNNHSWSNFKCYFNGDLWPGSTMTLAGTNSDGQSVYYREGTTSVSTVVFSSNGNPQTYDAPNVSSECRWWIGSLNNGKYNISSW